MKAISLFSVSLAFLFVLMASSLVNGATCTVPVDRDCVTQCNYSAPSKCTFDNVDCSYCWSAGKTAEVNACFDMCELQQNQAMADYESCDSAERANLQACIDSCESADKKAYDEYRACLKNNTQATTTPALKEASADITITHPDGTTDTTNTNIVKSGDTIKAGRAGGWITTEDGDRIKLAPYTELKIKDPTLSELLGGKIMWLRAKAKQINHKFEIRTPPSVLAVRGTEFIYEYANSKTTLYLHEGEVDVTPVKGGIDMLNETQIIEAGHMVVVDANGIMTITPLSEQDWALQAAAFENIIIPGVTDNQVSNNQTTDGTGSQVPANPCATAALLLLSGIFLFAFAYLKRR